MVEREIHSIHQYKEKLIQDFAVSILTILFFLVILAYPLSLSRIATKGFMPVYFVHTLISASVFIFFFNRKRFRPETLMFATLVIYLIIFVIGALQWGLASGAMMFLPVILAITTIGYGRKAATILTAASFLFLSVVGVLFVNEVLISPGSLDVYIRKPASWAVTLVSALITSATIWVSLSTLFKGFEGLTDKLQVEKERTEAANRAKSEFLANMSHEIRTPLNAIIGFSELLTDKLADPMYSSYMKSINTAGSSLLVIINDILDLSKIDANQMTLEIKPTSLPSLLKEIELIFKAKVDQKELTFSTEIEDTLPLVVKLDEVRVRQILVNLVGNALKFTEMGYVHVRIYLADRENSHITLGISVEDTGIGILPQNVETIFDAFQQQDDQSQSTFGGTGLGLAITKRFVELMDGEISVKSTPCKGSLFTVTIPAVLPDHAELPEYEEDQSCSEEFRFPGTVALVADDVESNRKYLTMTLKSLSVDVITADNGQHAVALALSYLPDIIFMDIRMPILSGKEATKKLKSEESTANIPVVAVTASVAEMDKVEPYDNFLYKPLNKDRLIECLKQYLPFVSLVKHVDKSRTCRIHNGFNETIEWAVKKELRDSLGEEHERVMKVFNMPTTLSIAETIRKVSEQESLQSLNKLAEDLNKAANAFDISETQLILKDLKCCLNCKECSQCELRNP